MDQRPTLVKLTDTLFALSSLFRYVLLTERIDGPERGRNPAVQGDLQDQADDAGDRATDGKEQQEGQEDGDQQAHGRRLRFALALPPSLGDSPPPRPA